MALGENGNRSTAATYSNSDSRDGDVGLFALFTVCGSADLEWLGCPNIFGHSCFVIRVTWEKFDEPSTFTAATRNSMAMKQGGGSKPLLSMSVIVLLKVDGASSPRMWRADVTEAGHRDGERTRHSDSEWAWTSRHGVHFDKPLLS